MSRSLGFCMLLSFLLYKIASLVASHGSARNVVFLGLIFLVVGAYSARTVLRNEGLPHASLCVD